MSLRMSLQHEEGVHAKVCLTQNNFYVLFTDAAVTYTKICRHSSWQTRYINYGHESLCHALSILEPFDCPAVLSWQRWTGINGTIHWRCQMQGQSLPCRCQKNSRNIQTARANYPWYMGWSDVTYLWSQCDRHFVGQHVVLRVVKWWRFVALFESSWISWFKKMFVLSLSYWESDVYWRQNNKHFAELAPQNGGKQLIWKNYVTVTMCINCCTWQTAAANGIVLVTLWPAVGDEVICSVNFTEFVIRQYFESYCIRCILYFTYCTEMK